MWPFTPSSKAERDEYPTAQELRAMWDIYSDQWPKNNDLYSCWKPAAALPAPKWALKRAMKLSYAEWPEPIDWTVFSAFHMEFVDLALHLPQESYLAIERFRQHQVDRGGAADKHDPLLMFRVSSSLAVVWPVEQCEQEIIRARDRLRRSATWNPVGVDDQELDEVRKIILESTADFASLIQEWRFYILSIGRDQYISKK